MDSKKKIGPLRIAFEAEPLPEFEEKEVKGKDYVFWGKDNKYPDFLLENFEQSPNHSSIVKRKSFYISGNGFVIDEFATEEDRLAAQAFIDNDKGSETLNDINNTFR